MSKKNQSLTRRQVLKGAAGYGLGLSVAPLFSSCTILDGYFGMDRTHYIDEVIIAGGGSAGLAAAFELKKRKIPYRLMEGASRIGGRVYSVNSGLHANEVIELGASDFDLKDKMIFDLAKEFKLEVEENINDLPEQRYFVYNGKWIHQRNLIQLLEPYMQQWNLIHLKLFGETEEQTRQKDHPLTASFDQWPLKDYLQSLKPEIEPELTQLLLDWASTELGPSPEDISALQWILFWNSQMNLSTSYRIQGGNQQLIWALHDRVIGAIPNHLVQVNTTLVSVSENNGRFECGFDTPQGIRRISSPYLILALPLNQLRKVRGFNELEISPLKKEAAANIQINNQIKIVIESKENWAKFKSSTVPFYKRLVTGKNLKYWQSSFHLSGLYSSAAPLESEDVLVNKFITEASSQFKKPKNQWTDFYRTLNWSQRSLSCPGVMSWKLGEYSKYRGIFTVPDYEGRLSFAGDYTHSTQWNRWVGALESGQRAAFQIANIHKKG